MTEDELLERVEKWVKESCPTLSVRDWHFDGQEVTIFGEEIETYHISDLFDDIEPQFVILSQEGEFVGPFNSLTSATDAVIEREIGWEVYKLSPLTSKDIERWLPESKTPIGYLS